MHETGYLTKENGTWRYLYYLKDHVGSNRVVLDDPGGVVQINNFYPYGLTQAEPTPRTDQAVQPYKFGGKELDRDFGVDVYDFEARMYNPAIGRFMQPDPLAEKYYSISPYAYCANNPIRNIDLRGDSVTVLNLGTGTDQHSAMLIQNGTGKWQYYSMNGDWVYNTTGGMLGGKSYHDLGEKTFNSPQEFLESAYNAKGDKQQISDNEVNNYGFTEGYVLPTTPEQDNVIRSTFTDISTNENYSIISNNCATTVQRSLNAVGINTSINRREADAFISTPPKVYNSWLPSETFRAIRTNNSNGIYIKR